MAGLQCRENRPKTYVDLGILTGACDISVPPQSTTIQRGPQTLDNLSADVQNPKKVFGATQKASVMPYQRVLDA